MRSPSRNTHGKTSSRRKPGLSRKHAELLGNDFGRLAGLGADLPAAALRYVIHGRGPDVLARLSGTPGCGRALGLAVCVDWRVPGGDRDARRRFFEKPPLASAGFFLRLARLYDAAARPDRLPLRRALGLPDWVDLFLLEVNHAAPNVFRWGELRIPFKASVFEQMIVAAGEPGDSLARAAVLAGSRSEAWNDFRLLIGLGGFAAMTARHPDVITEGLDQLEAERRIHVLQLMHDHEIDPGPFASRIVELAISPAKTVREAALPLLVKISPLAARLVRARAEAGVNEERLRSVQLLWRLEGEQAREFLTGRLQQENWEKARNAITELLGDSEPAQQESETAPELLPVAPLEPIALLAPSTKAALASLLRQGWQAENTGTQRNDESMAASPPPDDGQVALAIRFIEGTEAGDSSDGLPPFDLSALTEPATEFAGRADLGLVNLVRLAALIGMNDARRYLHLLRQFALKRYVSIKPRFSLRDLGAAVKAAGRDENEVAQAILGSPWLDDALLRFDAVDVWPYFAERAELLERAWYEKEDHAFHTDRKRALIFKALALFPVLPERFVRLSWDVAFDGTRKERLLAQAALAKVPDKEERIVAALSGGKAEHRAIAAEWLAHLGCKEAVPALEKALAKEKQALTASIMMAALETLGVPLDEFVSMDALVKEAKLLLRQGIPGALSWLDLVSLPPVRWAASGKPVGKEVLQWMILHGFALGMAEPGPRLRQIAAHFDRACAEELGQYVLEAWIERDLTPPQKPEQADREIGAPLGSASREKGILAVAGACCGERAAPLIEWYVKTHHRRRVPQCKALIRVLSWVDHPGAIRLLLSVSKGFRASAIRKEAKACIHDLVERRKWTFDELSGVADEDAMRKPAR